MHFKNVTFNQNFSRQIAFCKIEKNTCVAR